ncbi:hypothetical protein [Olleya sp. YS]|uniref:hypothetical protein n=1 Tax=Olleya sp. YS TaxID=3028318 RepID=UPI0024343CD2|nr:hypothetical protein [Olleya sp. YS]WGD35436.1 hypothetical protein Ollyesu_03285 [Olleya sp. YS]
MIKIAKIIIVPILCVLSLSFVNFWIIPLIFCLVITLCNLKEFNFKTAINFFVASYISFILGILVYSLIGNLLELVLEKRFQIGKFRIVDISYLFVVGIISPMLFFYINSLFIKKISFFNNLRKILIGVIVISLALIIIYSYDIHSDFSFKIWQFVVAIILQYIILNNFDNGSEMENIKT